MAKYVSRPLAQQLQSAHRKVVVLEGARAVGKTMMVQNELPGYHYETLANRGTYDYASRHLEEWVQSLSTPTIIDEAQRLPALPLAVKGVVDKRETGGPQFVLTGSASITRTGLDGQDPLTRRSQRFTLSPLTRREVLGNAPVSVVDALWNSEPNLQYHSMTTRDDLIRYMTLGGFPTYVFMSPVTSNEERRLSVRTDIDDVLGDTILPDEHLDKSIAESALRELLTVPGGILNFKRIADSLGKDPRTVERYVSIFLKRFLLFSLPNLKLTANRQNLARTKIHPVDTSFSSEAFASAGKDIRTDRVLFGQLFESFAVTQIVPEIQWSTAHPDAFYWREAGKHPKEVDLVLVRDSELIGIEMKSRESIERSDFAGLAQLRESDPRFKRGFVVYTGKETRKMSDDMWALPISALWDGDGFVTRPEDASLHSLVSLMPKKANIGGNTMTETSGADALDVQSSDANLFLSYRHADDKHLNGAIVALAHAIVEEYAFQFGSALNLFVDNESITWGDDWRKALDQSIDKANIIIPAVTPQYILSIQCRKELLEFNSRVDDRNGNRILPLLWQDITHVQNIDHKDPVWVITHDRQWLSVEQLRHVDPSSFEYKRRVEEIVRKLRGVIESQNKELDQAPFAGARNQIDSLTPVVSKDSDLQDGLLEQFAVIEKLGPHMNRATEKIGESVQILQTKMSAKPVPQNGSAIELISWGNELANIIQPDIDELDLAIDDVASLWDHSYSALQSTVELIERLPRGSGRNSQIESLDVQLGSIIDSLALGNDIEQSVTVMRTVSDLLRSLKPLSMVFERSINLLSSMKSMTESLQDRLRELPR